MTTNPKRGRGRLRAVSPAGPVYDDRAEIARALLTRYAPVWPVIGDEMLSFLGHDQEKQEQPEQDPRYIIGRCRARTGRGGAPSGGALVFVRPGLRKRPRRFALTGFAPGVR